MAVILDMHGIFSICLSSCSYLVRVETGFVAMILGMKGISSICLRSDVQFVWRLGLWL